MQKSFGKFKNPFYICTRKRRIKVLTKNKFKEGCRSG